jgi:membrane protein required for colicin V production
MIWVDYVIVGIIGLSALISLVRGFVREAVSLIIWFLAFALAWTYFREFALHLTPWVETPSVRLGLAFIILLVTVLIIGAIVGWLIGQLVDKTGLSGTDRLLGMVFGAARGAVLVAILVLLAGLTPFPRDSWWQESQLIVHFQQLAGWLLSLLPPDIAEYFQFVHKA